MENRMEQNCEWQEGQLVVQVPKELDHHEAGKLRAQIDMCMENKRVSRLVFDFSQTEFMDSSGIGVLIGRCRKMGYFGGEVVAENLGERVQKIFQISGLYKLIRII
jgi:stage II sporulation protein AA (anti-sigma F factor antagonist)